MGGWSSHDVNLPHGAALGNAIGQGVEYPFLFADLSLAVVEPFGPFTSLAPEVFPLDTGRTPYLRHDLTCASEPGTCYEPVATAAEGNSDVRPGAEFAGVEETNHRAARVIGAVNVRGVSPDLEHVIVKSNVQLTSVATPAGVSELYEWSAGKPPTERLELVSLNENNLPASTSAELGYEDGVRTRLVVVRCPSDGSRVFWSEPNGGGLFVRDVAKGVSLRLDLVQGGSGSGPCRTGLPGRVV